MYINTYLMIEEIRCYMSLKKKDHFRLALCKEDENKFQDLVAKKIKCINLIPKRQNNQIL